MRVLVTGATGLVGRALCPALTAAGHEVLRAVRRDDGMPSTVVTGDLGHDCGWLDGVGPLDAIVHLAARVHQMKEAPEEAERLHRLTNLEGTLALARAAQAQGVRRFVFMSTVKVNGEGGARPYRGDDIPAPADAYARSKAAAEEALFELSHESGMEVVVIRPPLVHGPGVAGNLRSLLNCLRRGIPLPLASVDGNRRSLVGVDNLSSLIALCLHHPAAAGRVWMVGDGEDVSTSGLIRALARVLHVTPRLWRCPVGLLRLVGVLTGRSATVARLCGDLVVDIGPTREQLGWVPPLSLLDGLKRCVGRPEVGLDKMTGLDDEAAPPGAV